MSTTTQSDPLRSVRDAQVRAAGDPEQLNVLLDVSYKALHPDAALVLLARREEGVDVVLAHRDDLTEAAEVELASRGSHRTCTVLARHVRSESAQRMLMGPDPDANSEVTSWILANNRLHPDLQDELTRSSETWVLHALARTHALTPSTAAVLLGMDSSVREVLAGNPVLPELLQVVLARDPEAAVRTALAHNPGIATGAAVVLTTDPDRGVWRRLVFNPHAPVCTGMPMDFLQMRPDGQDLIGETIKGFDPSTLSALTGFAGTLAELKAVLESFEPD